MSNLYRGHLEGKAVTKESNGAKEEVKAEAAVDSKAAEAPAAPVEEKVVEAPAAKAKAEEVPAEKPLSPLAAFLAKGKAELQEKEAGAQQAAAAAKVDTPEKVEPAAKVETPAKPEAQAKVEPEKNRK